MKKVFTILILALAFNSALSQAPSIVWQCSLGSGDDDEAFSIKQTSDGGFIVGGYAGPSSGNVTGNHGETDFWITKLDQAGNLIWQKSIGGSLSEYDAEIFPTNDGGYIMSGYTFSNDGDISGLHSLYYYDYWVAKLDSAANIIWQKCLGGPDMDRVNNLIQVSDGGYILAGETFSFGGDVTDNHAPCNGCSFDVWLVRIDSMGNVLWKKCYGGISHELCYSICETPDHGFAFIGDASFDDGDVSGVHGLNDVWVVKISSGGAIEWQKCYGGSSNDGGAEIKTTGDGGYLIAGGSHSNDGDATNNFGDQDAWLIKIDSVGNIIWQKNYGGSSFDLASSIEVLQNGGIIMLGVTMSNDIDVSGNHGNIDYWLTGIDNLGNLQWQKCIGGSGNEFHFAAPTSILTVDSEIVFCGTSDSWSGDITGNHGFLDYCIFKLSSSVTNISLNQNSYFNSAYYHSYNLILNINSRINQPLTIQLFDLTGRLTDEKTVEILAGKNDLVIPWKEIKSGIYIVRIGNESSKLVVY